MKVVADTTCPGCNKDHPVELDIPEPPKAKNVKRLDAGNDDIHSELEAMKAKIADMTKPKEPVTPAKEKIKVKLPSWQAKEFCADGSCTASHKNPDYKQRVKKKCTNCGQMAPAKAARCATCTKQDPDDPWEELTDDDLDEIGIPMPEPEAHEHHHEHHEGE